MLDKYKGVFFLEWFYSLRSYKSSFPINDQGIEVLNTSVDEFLWHFNTFPTTAWIEFISQILNLVVVALNASDLAILNES